MAILGTTHRENSRGDEEFTRGAMETIFAMEKLLDRCVEELKFPKLDHGRVAV